eukprot:COSAG04_NODE_2852_length_3486_cov_1.350162_1_plen_144_part_10
MGCAASSGVAGADAPQLVHATVARVRHVATNWSHAQEGGPGCGARSIEVVVGDRAVELLEPATGAHVSHVDLYTIKSWRATPNQLLLKMTESDEVMSFDVPSAAAYTMVQELQTRCQALAAEQQQPAPATVAVATPAAAPAVDT